MVTRTEHYFNYVPLCTMNGDSLRPQSVQRGEAMLLADTLGAQHTITKPRGACSWGEVSGAGLHAKQGALQGMLESSLQIF